MIDFLRSIDVKAYNQIIEIAGRPNLLFSNDGGKYHAEANYNMYTIQKLNKWIENNKLSVDELEQIFTFIEHSWSVYLSTYFKAKSFVFYVWGDYQIPALRLSVVSFYKELELPFKCALNKVNSLASVMNLYHQELQLNQCTILEADPSSLNEYEAETPYILTVYSKVILC
ncbi:hypothetical protein [Paenibacillus wenxiniae]|uniref:Uncharacterized protein n=1 Tax=Paenibacillus wenxiniae TaxID=1636843 RepID=A0ABW4RQW9_9BACL